MTATNLPTRTWRNPRWAATPEWARPIIQSLEQFLARPTFYNGVHVGDGDPPTRDIEGVITQPATTPFQQSTIAAINASLAGLGTDLTTVYATLASMAADITSLETDPIDGTRITSNSIDTPQLRANSITAAKLAAVNIGVGKWIASTSYSAGVSGWIIDAAGTAEFNSVTVRGTVVAGGGDVTLDSTGIKIASGTGNTNKIRWLSGSTTLGAIRTNVTGELRLDATDITLAPGLGGAGQVTVSGDFHVSNDTTISGTLGVTGGTIIGGALSAASMQSGGSAVVTAATANNYVKGGYVSTSTDSNGRVAVTHGLGSTPDAAFAIINYLDVTSGFNTRDVIQVAVYSITSTVVTFQFTIGNSSGGAWTSAAVGFYWSVLNT